MTGQLIARGPFPGPDGKPVWMIMGLVTDEENQLKGETQYTIAVPPMLVNPKNVAVHTVGDSPSGIFKKNRSGEYEEGKTMRHVVDEGQVAHLWAHRAQDNARNKQGNFYFDGDTIYSYGEHFPIAKHWKHKKKTAILLTTRTYSQTTRGHIYNVVGSVRHRDDVIRCQNVAPYGEHDHKKNLSQMRYEFNSALEKGTRARQRVDEYVGEAESLVKQHTAYRAFFGLRLDKPLMIPADWKEATKVRLAKAAEVTAKQNEKLIRDTNLVLKYWKQGDEALRLAFEGKKRPTHKVDLVPCALRLHIEGDKIETSLGANVPLEHARILWRTIQKIQSGQQPPYQHNGHTIHVGSFRVDSIDAAGTLIAGCHTIPFASMAELATMLGW